MKKKMNVAIQASNNEIHEDCLSCGYNINHPLCPECIAKGFKQWLLRFPKDEEKIIKQVNKFLAAHRHIDGNAKKCSACGKQNTYLCPYCFTEYLYKLAKEAGLGVQALSEFLFIFNFDFEHNGYSRELEAFGGY